MRRTPLAWYNLLHDQAKSLVAIAGVSFALTAIFMQSGFLQSVLRTATIVTDKLDYELVIISDNYLYLAEPSSFPRAYLSRAESIPGVRHVAPIYIFTSTWRNPERRPGTNAETWEQQQQRRPVLVIGFDLADHPFRSQGAFRPRRSRPTGTRSSRPTPCWSIGGADGNTGRSTWASGPRSA